MEFESLITSKNEGLPLVMLEAAGSGRATMSRDVGGIGEFIAKKDEFLVFPSTNLFSHYAKEVVSGTKYSMPNWFS